MFYSHQLLARKAPLGQIWMAATVHAKINRKSLNKLNLIKICEEILNPSIPMALRLSGILMGGVVIVYERKVKLLYDDVTRLLVEINEAWKVKAAQDPTVLPKGKLQAKRETVTLPEKKDKDVADMEQSLYFSSSTTTMGFQQTAFFAVRLDDIDEPDVDKNPRNDDLFQQYHQADAENITLLERFDTYQGNMEFYNRFERFDIEGDEETQMNNNSGEPTEFPTTLVPSPPDTNGPQRGPVADQGQEEHPEHQGNQQYDECKEAKQHELQPIPRRVRRKPRRQAAFIMDNEQTMIPGHIYRSWFQDTLDIISKRGKKRKLQACKTLLSSMKIAKLMDLPSVVLMDDVLRNGIQYIYYPAPLMELYMRSIQPCHDSPSARNSAAAPPDPSSVSPDDGFNSSDPMRYPFEDFQAGLGSPSVDAPVEKIRRTALVNDNVEILLDELKASRIAHGSSAHDANVMATPGNSGGEMKSAGSTPERERSNKKRPYSSSKHSGSSLDPVAEEYPVQHLDPAFNLSRLSEKDQNTEQEMLVETGPTPTQYPVAAQALDKMTDTIRMHMKTHFETSGAPQEESVNNLAAGMNRKGAALLFYQTCVLATHDFLRVQQKVAYGDILISKGSKM